MNTLTDISSDVEAAFDEMECIFGPSWKVEHGGDKVAYFVGHGCLSGFICQSHMDYYLSTYGPLIIAKIELSNGGVCAKCDLRFHSVDEHHKVYPL